MRREIIDLVETPLSRMLLHDRSASLKICIERDSIALLSLSRV